MPSSITPPLDILYQDEWLVAVNKPSGHLVHPADHPQEGDQVTMKILRDQLGQLVYNVHRIDRPTTGVLLFGIDSIVAKHLHRALERHEVKKTYLAVVKGTPQVDQWQCHEPIQKEAGKPIREAHTSFNVLAKTIIHDIPLTLVEATPHTGRFHQIRRHLLHAGLPITGDYRYAGIEESDHLGKTLGTGSRMLLQSRTIAFDHPITGDQIHIQAPADIHFTRCFPHYFAS